MVYAGDEGGAGEGCALLRRSTVDCTDLKRKTDIKNSLALSVLILCVPGQFIFKGGA